jgi:nitrogen fixation/metabolism regulation signal transduction histidine kinase
LRKLGAADDKTVKHLNRIDEQVALCDSIVGELLEYTRGRHSEARPAEINPFLEEILEQTTFPDDISLVRDLSENLPEISIDKEKMRRVMNNLIENALHAVTARRDKAQEMGVFYQPQVRVGTSYIGDRVCVEVEDNGIGMDEETSSLAFDPLFTTRARGTGLGLAVVRKILQEHGAVVDLNSAVDNGTKISFAIHPLKETSLDDSQET